MVIPDFGGFANELKRIFEQVRRNDGGAPADYIPQLNLQGAAADSFGLALCSIDGQRLSLGDATQFFSIQSTSKPISYCLALEEHGAEMVHRFVGREPSGVGFNEIALDKADRPHNPMVNAGAIMTCALIGLGDKATLSPGSNDVLADARGWSGRRIDYVLKRWAKLCGNELPRFSTSVFLSERETADRNYALAYFMREKKAFPDDVDIHDVLEFYLQCCAIELNCELMSVVAATLANGGICPVTGERVFKTETVRNCLSLMSSCGMYDFSGEFAFTIGLPAKSGVFGAVMVVVPNVAGFCTWSPRLDELGNSVRGIDFCQRLVNTFNFHSLDDLSWHSSKKDPRMNPIQVKARHVNEMIWAASKGDLGAIQSQLQRDAADASCADYDLRTPLHLAAAEDQRNVVQFFIDEATRNGRHLDLNPKDRWGGTPLDDAYLQGHASMIDLLEQAGADRGDGAYGSSDDATGAKSQALLDSPKTDELIWAASLGNIVAVRRLAAQGIPLETADYDYRTALHLAAAEGHLEVVSYIIAHGVPINPTDRWGNTPLSDALRHDCDEVADVLRAHGGACREEARSMTRTSGNATEAEEAAGD
ncbi:MAG: glutaminase A [Thiohalocapsa sp.]